MTLAIHDLGGVAFIHGFFQTSMYAPHTLVGDGFRVACGEPGAGGVPTAGRAYEWTIRARDSAGTNAANYGTVFCPAYNP